MHEIVVDDSKRFEVVFDNDNGSLDFRPVAATNGEFVDLSMGGESAAIAISVVFRGPDEQSARDLLFVFENIAGDPISPGPHAEGDILDFDATSFSTGDGLLSGFSSTKLTVTVGPTRENPFKARLILSNDESCD